MVGNDYYDLKMDFDGQVELQDETDRGPYFIMNRFKEIEVGGSGYQPVGNWNPKWVYETIRIGLVRGGLDPRKAIKLCDRYVREGFVMDYVDTAADVLLAGLYGPEEEPVELGELNPEAMTSPTPSDESNGASSTSSPEPLD